MSTYALVRIRPGARCFQDFKFFDWDLGEDNLFVAERMMGRASALVWECKAPGAGEEEDYGRGSILVVENGLEFLTPQMVKKPELPRSELDVLRNEIEVLRDALRRCMGASAHEDGHGRVCKIVNDVLGEPDDERD